MLHTHTHAHSPASWNISYKTVYCVVCWKFPRRYLCSEVEETGRKECSWPLNLTLHKEEDKNQKYHMYVWALHVVNFQCKNKFHCFILLSYFPDTLRFPSVYFKTTSFRGQRSGKGCLLTRQTWSSDFSLPLRSSLQYRLLRAQSRMFHLIFYLKNPENNPFHDSDIHFILSILITYYSKPLPLHIHALSPSLVI